MSKNGCWNTPRLKYYFAPDRTYIAGHDTPYIENQRKIENTMTIQCQYDRKTTDPECKGCLK